MVAATEISVDAAAAAVLSELDDSFALEEEQKKWYGSLKDVFSLPPTGNLELLPNGSTGSKKKIRLSTDRQMRLPITSIHF